MKKFIFIFGLFLLLIVGPAMACDVCQTQQPKVLRNITHGTGPEGQLDFVIITISAIIVGLTLIFSVKYLLRPGEKSPDHVKNMVIDNF